MPEIKDGVPTAAYTIYPDIVAVGLALRGMYLAVSRLLMRRRRQSPTYHDGLYVPEGSARWGIRKIR